MQELVRNICPITSNGLDLPNDIARRDTYSQASRKSLKQTRANKQPHSSRPDLCPSPPPPNAHPCSIVRYGRIDAPAARPLSSAWAHWRVPDGELDRLHGCHRRLVPNRPPPPPETRRHCVRRPRTDKAPSPSLLCRRLCDIDVFLHVLPVQTIVVSGLPARTWVCSLPVWPSRTPLFCFKIVECMCLIVCYYDSAWYIIFPQLM
jgi:hypothetical protein